MKKVYFIATLLFIGGLTGCSSKVRQDEIAKEEFRPRGQLFWVEPTGLYKGAIPCSNCAGIEVTLNFKADNTVEKSMRYIKKGGQTKHLKGTWVVQEGNIVQITYPLNTPVEFYKAKSGAHLIALNSKKEEDKNPTGQFNVFNKD
jgi:hypothetical protein